MNLSFTLIDVLAGLDAGNNFWGIAERVVATMAAVVGIISGVIALWRRGNNRKAKLATPSG